MRKLVIFAANGFLGKELVSYFHQQNYSITVVTRNAKDQFPDYCRHEIWDGRTLGNWTNCLTEADYIVNLAGKSVDCRYTKKNKAFY